MKIKSGVVKATLVVILGVANPLLSIPEEEKSRKDSRVYFESSLLAFADGKSYGVNAEHIGMTLQLIHELGKMLDGEKTATGHVGIFSLQGALHTTRTLAALEVEYEKEWAATQAMQPHDASKKQREELCTKKRALLNVQLDEAKKHFNTKVAPFMSYARGMRDIVNDLILESCRKRNRIDSYMLTFSKCEEGKEAETIQKNITTCDAMNMLVLDLVNFLKDFVHSCPKARALFMELVKHNNKKNS